MASRSGTPDISAENDAQSLGFVDEDVKESTPAQPAEPPSRPITPQPSQHGALDESANTKESTSERVDSPQKISSISPNLEAFRPLCQQRHASIGIDLLTWNGWVELESEPILFNAYLRDAGVTGLKVVDVPDLFEYTLASLPGTIRAFIFLFSYKETKREELDHADVDCWFAQQTADNACASVALLNILNNIPGAKLGEELTAFKEHTDGLSSLERGEALADFPFVRAIHNSFATNDEITVAELELRSKAKPVAKRKAEDDGEFNPKGGKRAKGNNGKLKKGRQDQPKEDADQPLKDVKRSARLRNKGGARRRSRRNTYEPAYHYCAYMPVQDHLLEFDGLEQSPENLGKAADGDWTDKARDAIQARMMAYEDEDIAFNLMAVIDDPKDVARKDLCNNIKTIQHTEERLAADKDGKCAAEPEKKSELITGPTEQWKITQQDLDEIEITNADGDLAGLITLRDEAMEEQPRLRRAVLDHEEADQREYESTRHRWHDWPAFVRAWMNELAEASMVGELIGKKK